jgi:hypothetical protein
MRCEAIGLEGKKVYAAKHLDARERASLWEERFGGTHAISSVLNTSFLNEGCPNQVDWAISGWLVVCDPGVPAAGRADAAD